MSSIAPAIFALDPGVRYVAVNKEGKITEMEQNADHPTLNPHTTDEIEEKIVNPTVLDITRRRGALDDYGVQHVVIRYDEFNQLVIPTEDGHVSIGLELDVDPGAFAEKVLKLL